MTADADVLMKQQKKSLHRVTKELSRFDNKLKLFKAGASEAANDALKESVEQRAGKAEAKLAWTKREVDAQVAKAKTEEEKATVSVEKTPDETRQRNEHHEAVVELEKLLVHARALTSDVPTN